MLPVTAGGMEPLFNQHGGVSMNDNYQMLLHNWEDFIEDNPAVLKGIQDGNEVAVYDQETKMVVVVKNGGFEVIKVDHNIGID